MLIKKLCIICCCILAGRCNHRTTRQLSINFASKKRIFNKEVRGGVKDRSLAVINAD